MRRGRNDSFGAPLTACSTSNQHLSGGRLFLLFGLEIFHDKKDGTAIELTDRVGRPANIGRGGTEICRQSLAFVVLHNLFTRLEVRSPGVISLDPEFERRLILLNYIEYIYSADHRKIFKKNGTVATEGID